MSVEQIFDLNDGNILPSANDDVLHPTGNADIALLVPASEIPGIEPAFGIEWLDVGSLEIAAEHVCAAHQERARNVDWRDGTVCIDDLDFHTL